MKRILISLLAAALLTGCTGVESQPMKIQSDPDTRPVAERMAALYGTDFTLIDEEPDFWTLRGKNGLTCHVMRYYDDFDMPENTVSETYCDDYTAVCVSETPQMQQLFTERGAYIKAAQTGDAAERLDYAHFVIPCAHYEDIADIYRETAAASESALGMYYGQQGHWNAMAPCYELTDAETGTRLLIFSVHVYYAEEQLRNAQDAFAEICYANGRRGELPDAAVLQCPQSGMYLIETGSGTQYLPLIWKRNAQCFAVDMKREDSGIYQTPDELFRLLERCGAAQPDDGYDMQLTENDLAARFGITLELDPLTMTGSAKRSGAS